MRRHHLVSTAVAALVTLPLLTACGAADSGKTQVVASFYPLQYVAERVAGEYAEVTNLTQPGVEPHDLELTPRQAVKVSNADVGVYELGLQPSIDKTMKNDPPKHVLNVTDVVELAEAPEGTDEHADDHGHPADPHFWLDPTLLAEVGDALAAKLAEADPSHKADFVANAAALRTDLEKLDADFKAGLATCSSRALVVSHDAFGYLARRYDLDVHPIAGLSPDAEPSLKHLNELSELIKSDKITTVFNERLASPKLAKALASDLGITTAVLDPIEGLSSEDADADYVSLMRENLAAIQKADSCT